MDRLEHTIRPYAWGSTTAIPELLGIEPTGGPQAELWLGAYPGAPSILTRGDVRHSLDEWIATDPMAELGKAVAEEFGFRLPFLLKVLAAAEPLSLQAHPSARQAREGYAEEEERGVPIDGAERNYKDASHKPELLCALTEFEALCGFRPVHDTVRLLDALGVADLGPYIAALRARPDAEGVREAFTALMTAPDERRSALVESVLDACAALVASGGELTESAQLALDLGKAYPGDVGVVSALFLNHLVLAPGQAVFMPAGSLHAYMRGMAIEVMANSDNVLRGGLTPKHVDVPELLRILDFTAAPIPVLLAQREANGEEVYPTHAREFRLSRIDQPGQHPVVVGAAAPQILLCIDGEVRLRQGDSVLALPRGTSAFIAAGGPDVTVDGHGTAFRATVQARRGPTGG